jgi:hypothetical protein
MSDAGDRIDDDVFLNGEDPARKGGTFGRWAHARERSVEHAAATDPRGPPRSVRVADLDVHLIRVDIANDALL